MSWATPSHSAYNMKASRLFSAILIINSNMRFRNISHVLMLFRMSCDVVTGPCPCHLKNPINRRRAGIIFDAPARQNAAPCRRGATQMPSLPGRLCETKQTQLCCISRLSYSILTFDMWAGTSRGWNCHSVLFLYRQHISKVTPKINYFCLRCLFLSEQSILKISNLIMQT